MLCFFLILTFSGGLVFSPTAIAQQVSKSSSPLVAQASSPTTRVSMRRATNRTAPSPRYSAVENKYPYNAGPAESPRRQPALPSKGTPQPLSLAHAPPMAHGIQLVSPHNLPDRF